MEHIYKKIKNLRLEQGMTLKDLSEKTNLSVSFLSQIERGSSSLAITSFKKIADAFNVSMSYFFEDTENHNYAVKKGSQKPFKVEGAETTHIRLAGKFPDRRLEPLKITLVPKQKDEQQFSHPGEELYYVLKGTVIFRIENKEYVLNEGDSIHFPSEKVHQWENPTSEETILLCVLTPVIF
ncbi:XRE family transcriptional regulator [Aquibacillus sp. 3ASR75-11]|uniref:XRE family transcriptional regulator n=1 Tax=Terrihalobacillus insolitus TaxID=2950438 RepID=A0A9X3WW80_9BACI|nr:XRE family transcriptional regulator [Terrihalobacillus insolitus]MDC3413785.1 XRE family transcriptional regulator [Terrihalobacillus insolitus]MDC3425953.1 XRE family transcriptional regulator [Terrihalobacillus insolitus]